mmetsp:Transcript_651/g.2029  ORF Transcript_651/g.2029 Transcript_651/m.2029 type:complete len:186 (-) Transcript_651:130-687(-)
MTPLLLATRAGNAPVLQSLIDMGADTSMYEASGWAALDLAAQCGHAKCAEILFSAAADATVGGIPVTEKGLGTPLMRAATMGFDDVVEVILALGNVPENDVQYALREWARWGGQRSSLRIQSLLDEGVPPEKWSAWHADRRYRRRHQALVIRASHVKHAIIREKLCPIDFSWFPERVLRRVVMFL